MPMQEEPIVGAHYEDSDGLTFEVTGFDEDEGTIDVLYGDGSDDQIDIDTWYEMELQKLKVKPDGSWPDDVEEEETVSAGSDDDDMDDEEDEDDYEEAEE